MIGMRGRKAGLWAGISGAAVFWAMSWPHAAQAEDWQQRLNDLAEGATPEIGFQPLQVAQTDPFAARDFDIPGQPLGTGLASFGQQAGLQVSVDAALIDGVSTPGVTGKMTSDDALGILLTGTGLVGQIIDGNTVVIARAPSGDTTTLAPMTVLASRQGEVPLSNVPASITVIDREEAQKESGTANRLDEIIAKKVPGFNPTNNGVRQIRGRTAQVLINGVPVNEQLRASSGSDLNLISVDQVSGVEVSRGANSAYGFGSPGGIIALQTPRASSEELELHTIVRESVNPSHFDGSSQASLYQSAGQIVGNFDYQVGGSVAYDGADYDPDGDLALGLDNAALLTNGKEYLYNLDASFGLDLGDAGSLRLSGTFGYVDFAERYTLNAGEYREDYGSLTEDPIGDNSFRRSHTVNLSYENPDILGSALKLEIFNSEVKTHSYESFAGDNFRDEQTNEYYGIRSSIATPLDFVLEGATITYGVDALRNRYFRPYFNDDTGDLVTYFAPDVTLDVYAPYAQLDLPIGDFRFSGGVRHERYSGHIDDGKGAAGIDGGDIQDFDLTLFNAGVVYSVDDNIDLYATFSQGAEITQLGRSARNAASADQVDPQPAKSNQYEIGVRGDWSDISFGVAGFYTESDLLSALQCDGINPCTPLREPREIWGVEANADWRIDEQWGTGGVFSWQEGIRKTEDGDTRRIGSRDIPPVLVTAYVDYDPFPWWRNRLQVNYRANRDPFGDSEEYGEGRVEDLFLVNATADFDVGPGELQLGVRNLLNTKYTSIAPEADNFGFIWIPEQGTRVTLSYSITW